MAWNECQPRETERNVCYIDKHFSFSKCSKGKQYNTQQSTACFQAGFLFFLGAPALLTCLIPAHQVSVLGHPSESFKNAVQSLVWGGSPCISWGYREVLNWAGKWGSVEMLWWSRTEGQHGGPVSLQGTAKSVGVYECLCLEVCKMHQNTWASTLLWCEYMYECVCLCV